MKIGFWGTLFCAGAAWAVQPLGEGGVAAQGWSFWQKDAKGGETALTPCTLNGGAVKG